MFHNKDNFIDDFNCENDVEKINRIISAVEPPKSLSPEKIAEKLNKSGKQPRFQKFIINNRRVAIAAMLTISIVFCCVSSAYLFKDNKISASFNSGSNISGMSQSGDENNAEIGTDSIDENNADSIAADSFDTSDAKSNSNVYSNISTTATPDLTTVVKVDSDYTSLYDVFDAMKSKINYKDEEVYNGGINQPETATEEAQYDTAQGAATASAVSSSLDKSYTKTNVQVEGVDEADIVKTDGNYIYLLSHYIMDNNTTYELKIVECNSGNMTLLSSTYVCSYNEKSTAQEMFLMGSKVAVILQNYNNITQNDKTTYYNIQGNQTTSLVVYDVSDRTAPVKQNTVTQNGYYLSSRLVGSRVTVITNQYINLYNTEREAYSTLLPTITNTAEGVDCEALPPDDIYIPKDVDDMQNPNYIVFTNSMLDSGESVTKAVLGCGYTVYATADKIYVAGSSYTYNNGIYENKTTISRFLIDGINIEASGGLLAEGSLLNQFTMDEYNGYFRIATTSNNGNNLLVFDGALNQVSEIEGLAKGESIQSVRFMGETAYLVTYLRTDPLFVIDLSDQTNPVLKGELELPGFSSYLHPIDSNTILGIGYADSSSNVKLSLFDVSDMENPKELATYIVGDGQGYTYSEATSNHKAVTYDSEKRLLCIPVQTNNYSTSNDNAFNGFELFKIDTNNITEVAKITCNGTDGNGKYYSSDAVNPQRSVIIDNFLYAVSPLQMVSVNLDQASYANELWMLDGYSMEQMFLNVGCNIINNSSGIISPLPYAFSSSISSNNGYCYPEYGYDVK